MANGQSQALVRQPAGERPQPGMTDEQLLARFNAGRDEAAERAFAALVHRHGPLVLRVCLQILGDRHRAEDAFQATFLVLARRARAIRRPELLANWLYGVALRTAWEAKMRDGRTRRREALDPTIAETAAAGDAARPEAAIIRREEAEALHDEVARLPERYRLPVVLCELEGLTYQEAAQRLRCPASTVGVRLSRARERLRVRLVRRGILPAGAALYALFETEGATAWVPPLLAAATARAAVRFAAGDAATAGLATGAAAAIARAVLRAMAAARFKAAATTVLAIGLAIVVGSSGWRRAPARPATPPVSVVPPVEDHRAIAPLPPPVVIAAPTPAAPQRKEAPAADIVDHDAPPPAPRVALASLRRPVRDEVARGEMLFMREWAPHDPLSRGGDGLGPLYNETSCVACHGLGAPGGAGPGSKNVVIITANNNPRPPKGLERIHPGFRGTRSTVLHRFGTDPAYGPWRLRFLESRPPRAQQAAKAEESVDDRVRRVAEHATLNRHHAGPVSPAPGVVLTVTERNTPALFGAGRIDAIPSEVLEEEVANQPAATRGRIGRDRSGAIGRFGWKAQVATLHEFVRGACAGELGLEVPGHSQPASPLEPEAKPKSLDMTEDDCDALVAYVRSLPAPVAIDPEGPQGTRGASAGRRLFESIGCASCHSPSLGEVRGIYSDLLLHDMGPSLSDAGVSYGVEGPVIAGGPNPNEWRTPPLWGFRDSGPYLHDGRAQTLEEAVVLHGGQGAKAAKAFFALEPAEQAQVEAFLKSLVAPAATAAPGMMLAAELEERVEPDEVRQAEAQMRQERAAAAARDAQRKHEAEQRRRAIEAARRAQRQYPIAVKLQRMGKTAAALEMYRIIVHDAPDTDEGRRAAGRIAELGGSSESR